VDIPSPVGFRLPVPALHRRPAPPLIRVLLLLLLFVPAFRAAADEWWAWTSLEFWKNDRAKAWLFLGNRLDLQDGPYVQIASPRFKYEVLPWLDVATGQSVLSIENVRTDERHLQWRPELEVNPHFNLTPHLSLEFRNRMEWRWNEGEDFTVHRSRQRLQLAYTFPQALGPWSRIFISNEWLTDLHRHQWTENRLIPAGLTLKLGPRTDLDLFYLLLSSRAQPHWRQESVVGTFLRVRL
jgi:hypothetical protein